MSALNNTKNLCKAAKGMVPVLMLCVIPALGSRAYAQAHAQPDAPTVQMQQDASPSANADVPPAVAKELQAVKARMAQMESQLKDLTAFVAPSATFAARSARPAHTEVTLTGTVSCGHCQGIQQTHKGYTPYSWALNSVSQGDDIVLVAQDKAYKLQGDKDKLLPFMSAKARVTGNLDGSTLAVESIGRAAKNE
jgi:energy-converting hydrogenase Eha subunit F